MKEISVRSIKCLYIEKYACGMRSTTLSREAVEKQLDRRQKTEDRKQKTEDRKQKTENGGQNTE